MVKSFKYLIILLTLLCFFANFIYSVATKHNHFGEIDRYATIFSRIPNTVITVFRQVFGESITITEKDPNFVEKNSLGYDLYGLNSRLNQKENEWLIELINLKNDEVQKSWSLSQNDFHYTDRIFQRTTPQGSILIDKNGIIVLCNGSFNLYRLDGQSNIVWHNKERRYHHTMNLDHEGNIWVCSREPGVFENKSLDQIVKYRDDMLTKIDTNTGETLFNKSISKILIENNLIGILYGSSNGNSLIANDPIHLNDIEPVIKDGEFYKKGDVFVSIRNKSIVFIYRPSTNKVVKVIQGTFVQQHDVDILSDSTIAIFNNNVPTMRRSDFKNNKLVNIEPGFESSGIEVYDFSNDSFSSLMSHQFVTEGIYTTTEGLYTILSNGDVFVESTNADKIYLFNEKEVLLNKYMNSNTENYAYKTHWMRIYENLNN